MGSCWPPHLLLPASWQSWVNQSSTLVWLLLGQHAWHQLSQVFQFPDLHIKWGIRCNRHFYFAAMANTQSLFADFQVQGPPATYPCPFSSVALFLWWWDFKTPNIQNQTNTRTLPFSVYLYLEQTVIKHVQLIVSKSLSVVIMTREHFSTHDIHFENEY